jgi:acyl-coenzyme A synthetase/AMP-(fatty) acid ligase
MLFSRWQEVLSRFPDRPAVIDSSGVTTFAALSAALKTQPVTTAPVFVHGSSLEVALGTLRGWRDGTPVVPLEKDASQPLLPRDRPLETAHMKLTPGIEGSPRAVFFSAAQIMADADRLVEAMGLRPGLPNLAAVSVTHSYGFSSIILPLLLHGVPVHSVDVPFPRVVADALATHPAVAVSAVPSMWRAWHRSGILAGSGIALAVSAGAPLSLELEHAVYESCGLKLHNFYGASECGGISYDASNVPREDGADLGTPLNGVMVTLGESGRFLVSSSSVALGYQDSREGEVLGGGQFLTQDHGRIERGRLLLESSGAESINVAGRKIGPAKIEAALLATGMVEKIRVFGVASLDRERVEEITALVRLKTGSSVEAVRLAATELLAGWEVPRHWLENSNDAIWGLSRSDLKRRFPGH